MTDESASLLYIFLSFLSMQVFLQKFPLNKFFLQLNIDNLMDGSEIMIKCTFDNQLITLYLCETLFIC